jgi:two-component system, LuxR family, sensor kinase FixL
MENLNKPIYTALSSELHTPASTILRHIAILKKHCNHTDHALAEETFSFAENSIENILGFIENFHFLNTSDQIKMNVNPQWFSFQDLITQIQEELRNLNLDTSRLKVIALPHLSKVLMDRYLVCRILVNLLSNALKFSGKRVDLEISLLKNKLTIAVRDFGIGIPECQIADIFNPFFRGENAIRFPGTGIGLSIVSRAVECLDGTVLVHSELEKGTEFEVIIPYQFIRKTNNKSKNKNLLHINKIQLHHD